MAGSRSPPRRRNASRDRSPGRDKRNEEKDVLQITSEDAAFVLGRGGSTKRKIERVSGARLDLHERELKLEIFGDDVERERANLYVKLILAQRVGPVYIDFNERRPDLSVVEVPEDCFGFVTGKKGAVLRSLEEEWGTLMFFAKERGRDGEKLETEKLAIFGPRRGRRGSELKVMSAVEHKHPRHFVDEEGKLRKELNQPGDDEDEYEWGYDATPLRSEDFSYALGSQGSTRKKLAKASGCILEYVGRTAFAAGSRRERRLATDYLDWLLLQRTGRCKVDYKERDDVTVVEVPIQCVGFITGHKGEALRRVELETDCFCFTDGEKGDGNERGFERLLIFGHSESGRKQAKYMVEDRVDERLDMDKRARDREDRGRYDDRRGRDRDRFDDHRRDDRDRGRRGHSRDRDSRRNDRGRSRSPPRR